MTYTNPEVGPAPPTPPFHGGWIPYVAAFLLAAVMVWTMIVTTDGIPGARSSEAGEAIRGRVYAVQIVSQQLRSAISGSTMRRAGRLGH